MKGPWQGDVPLVFSRPY